MMSILGILFALIGVSVALPNQDYEDPALHNVITVPPNCPPGQEWVNGKCREIWRSNLNTADLGVIDPSLMFENRNVITVPPNCPPGQQLINGICRDVWRYFALTTPIPKQFQYSDLEQTDGTQADEVQVVHMLEIPDSINRGIINVPKQCPKGYRLDAFGYCRPILH